LALGLLAVTGVAHDTSHYRARLVVTARVAVPPGKRMGSLAVHVYDPLS
jgi:hypothetical protein